MLPLPRLHAGETPKRSLHDADQRKCASHAISWGHCCSSKPIDVQWCIIVPHCQITAVLTGTAGEALKLLFKNNGIIYFEVTLGM